MFLKKKTWKTWNPFDNVFLVPSAFKLIKNSIHSVFIKIRKRRNVDFHRVFKDSVLDESLTNLDAKDAKRNVIKWPSCFYKVFFKNVLFHVNARPLNISVITYVWSTLDVLFWLDLYPVLSARYFGVLFCLIELHTALMKVSRNFESCPHSINCY